MRTKTAACIGLWIVLLCVPAVASANPSANRQADKDIAKASLLVIGDFPSGWRTQDANLKEGERTRSETRECKDYNKVYKKVRRTPHADSPDFAQGDQMFVDNTVVVFPNEQAASKAVTDALAGKTYESCISASTRKLVENRLHERNVQYDDVKVEVGDLSADQAGDATTAKSSVITITQGASQTTLYAELELVRVGRATTSISFQNSFAQFPQDLKASLIDSAVTRLRQALGSSGAAPPASENRPLGTAANIAGGRVTVHSYEQPATGVSPYQTPQMPGNEFAAADAEICATGASGIYAQSSDFAVQLSDNTQRPIELRKGARSRREATRERRLRPRLGHLRSADRPASDRRRVPGAVIERRHPPADQMVIAIGTGWSVDPRAMDGDLTKQERRHEVSAKRTGGIPHGEHCHDVARLGGNRLRRRCCWNRLRNRRRSRTDRFADCFSAANGWDTRHRGYVTPRLGSILLALIARGLDSLRSEGVVRTRGRGGAKRVMPDATCIRATRSSSVQTGEMAHVGVHGLDGG